MCPNLLFYPEIVPQARLNCAPTGFASTVPQVTLCPNCTPTVHQLCPRVFIFVPQLCHNCVPTVPS